MMAGIDRPEEDGNGSRSPERPRWSLSQRAKGIPTGKGRRIRTRTAITLPFAIRGIWRFLKTYMEQSPALRRAGAWYRSHQPSRWLRGDSREILRRRSAIHCPIKTANAKTANAKTVIKSSDAYSIGVLLAKDGPAICALGNSIEQPLCQPMNMGTCVVECHAEADYLNIAEETSSPASEVGRWPSRKRYGGRILPDTMVCAVGGLPSLPGTTHRTSSAIGWKDGCIRLRNSVSVSEHFLGDRRLITCSERHLWSAETVLVMKSKCRSHFQAMRLPGAG